MDDAPRIFTIGHSTHAMDRFLGLLHAHNVELVGDVRRYPGSRRHPQFNAQPLETALSGAGIAYEPLGGPLGGRRRVRRDLPHRGWRSASFRAYAEHMESPEFTAGLRRLEELARARRVGFMCAEGDWRRCHRRLIADALVSRGWQIEHIRADGRLERHAVEIQPELK